MKIYIERLPSETVNNIKNRVYTREELDKLHAMVKKKDSNKRRGYRRACIIMTASLLLIMALSVPMATPPLMWAIALTAGICVLLFITIKILAVDVIRRQFLKALKKGYPEWLGLYGAHSFSAHSDRYENSPTADSGQVWLNKGVPAEQIHQKELPPMNERFTFVIDDMFSLRGTVGLVVVGFVQGTVKKGTLAYILFPEYGTVRETTILDMELRRKNGHFQKAKSATDCHVSLLISGFTHKSPELKDAVITNVINM